MNIYFAEKLKSLRAERKVSQEKLAQYLNVSFQAVSKWETGNSYPDISLLPDIARYFGVTVDELLCVEKIDEKRLYDEYEKKTANLYRLGKNGEAPAVWQEAYKLMPNNIDVKEMLMSAYFDTDRNKYFDEFYELATEIYNGNQEGRACSMYYKGQAINQLARTFAERGETETALQWARKSVSIFNSKEIIEARIDKGEDRLADIALCTYWFLEELFYFVCYIDGDEAITLGNDYKQSCFKTVAEIFETVYKNDDMGFEQLQHLYNLYQGVAEYEAIKNGDENVIRRHLERAAECCIKSMSVKEHKLEHPMLYGWPIYSAPSDNKINIRFLSERLAQQIYDKYREKEWFTAIERKIAGLLMNTED